MPLTPEQVAALGLPDVPAAKRLSADEAAALGLPGAAPTTTKPFPSDSRYSIGANLKAGITGAARGITDSWFGAPPGVRPEEVAAIQKEYETASAENPTASKIGDFVGSMYTPEGAVGGELGGAALGVAVKSAAPYVKGGLRSLAEKAAVRSTNADRTAVRRAFKGSDAARQRLGRFMLDADVPLRSPKAIRDAAQGIAEEAGPQISSLATAADQAGAKVDLAAAVNAAKAARPVADLSKNTVTRETHAKIIGMLDDQIAQHGGQVPPSVAHDIRMQLDQLANWDQAAPKQVQKAWRTARSSIDDALDSTMQGAGMGDEWAAANGQFSQARKLSNPQKRGLADIGAERREGNRLGSPSEKASAIAGAMAGALHNPVAALAIPTATVAMNRFFFPASARTLNALSRFPAEALATPAGQVVGSRVPTLAERLAEALARRFQGGPMLPAAADQDPRTGGTP